MTRHKKKYIQKNPVWLVLLGLAGLALLITMLLRGANIALLNPQGPIAKHELNLMLLAVAVLLTIAIPTLTFLYFTAWKYRESNGEAAYNPHARHSKFFVFSLWAIPSIFMLVLALIMWPATHKLEPKKAIGLDTPPLIIQVVAMRWKWLFIYPQQGIATINFVQVPIETPVQFELTADEAPMSSFWIPQLAGQLYAMTGHVNRLNLMADTPGDYTGRSAEINGAGFAGMKFVARTSSKADFDLWVRTVSHAPNTLDPSEYQELLKPSENNPATFYSRPNSDLYATILSKYDEAHSHNTEHE